MVGDDTHPAGSSTFRLLCPEIGQRRFALHATGRPRQVAIVQSALRRYREGFYEALRADLARNDIDLLLFHSTPLPHEDDRQDRLEVPWATRLKRHAIPLGRRYLVSQQLHPRLRAVDLVVVEQASRLLLNYRLLWQQARGGPRVAFWGHGRDFTENRSSLGERAKASISRRVHWWFAYTSLSGDIVTDLGVDAARITVVNNAIDTTTLKAQIDAVDDARLAMLRQELGVGPGPVGLFLGTLRPDKHLEVLLEAGRRIRREHPDFGLLVAGSGPLEDDVRRWAEQEPWLHYLGGRYGSDRAEVLALADLLLLPGWVGLVVLDAIVAGTPLITSRDSPHGPEIAYLRDGENGLLVANGTDPDSYADAVTRTLDDPELLRSLVLGCAADRDLYSVEEMAGRFADGIRQALDAPPR